jgi:hypothetical protein
MAALPLRSITNPDTLAAFDASILHQVLDPHRAYLAGLGYHLPAQVGTAIDADALATALLRADVDFPEDLADAFHTIVEAGVDAQVGAIQAAARRAGIDLGVATGQAVTPLDLAARLWLRNPDLLKRIHAEASIPTVRRYESWRCDSDEIPAFNLPDEQRVVVPWTQDLERILVEHQFGPGVRIFVCPAGRLVFFLIRHGATVQRVSVHHDDGGTGSLIFRPAVTDVIRYDPAAGELGLHLQKHAKWLSEAIRTTFSLRIFNQPHLFSGERRYTLLPIQQRGRAAIDCDSFPTIDSVDLTELEFAYGDDLHYRVVHKATDVFAALESQAVAISQQPVPSAAKLKVVLTDESTRTVSLRAPNVAVYQRDGDDDVIGAFLLERGFILPDDAHERDQVA